MIIPAFQASAASGSEDLSTQEAKAMQTKHMSDCFSVEKMPWCPVRAKSEIKYVAFLHLCLLILCKLMFTCCLYSFQNEMLLF